LPYSTPPREDALKPIKEAQNTAFNINGHRRQFAIAKPIPVKWALGQNILLAEQIIKAKDNEDIIHQVPSV